jgi:ribosome-binding protein aMBF1 (putative translation factor)
MGVCSKCGAERHKLFDVVDAEGIVSVCEDCLGDDVPVVKKIYEVDFDDANNRKSVYERLGNFAGINLEKHKKFEERISEKEDKDVELKEIVKSRFNSELEDVSRKEENLLRNFHWAVMRARRLKKMTIWEVAREIKEPEEALRLVEQGRVPENNLNLIKKLEDYFGIYLLKEDARKKVDTSEIKFDPVSTKILTIDDLRRMKKEKEEEVFKEVDDKEDLSDKDIHDLIFGKK